MRDTAIIQFIQLLCHWQYYFIFVVPEMKLESCLFYVSYTYIRVLVCSFCIIEQINVGIESKARTIAQCSHGYIGGYIAVDRLNFNFLSYSIGSRFLINALWLLQCGSKKFEKKIWPNYNCYNRYTAEYKKLLKPEKSGLQSPRVIL